MKAPRKLFRRREKPQLEDKQRRLAKLSYVAYGDDNERQKAASELGYTYDPELSNDRYATFTSGMESYVAFRGTRPTDKDDL